MSVNKFFNPKNIVQDLKEEPISSQWKSSYVAKHFQKVTNLENDLMRVPALDEFLFLQSDNAFNAFTFIPFVAKHFPIKELYASTYSISNKVISALVELHDVGMIEKITLLISDSMIKRNPLTIENLKGMCSTRPNIQVFYAWTHAKVCLLQTHDFHFVIEGSGNWSENAHFEQYLFANCKGLFDFRKQLFENNHLKRY